MSYQLIFSDPLDKQGKTVGRNVFLKNLPEDHKVYIFYYSGAMPHKDLEAALRNLGIMTGKNLFVNIGKLNDPNYSKIANHFQIKKFPVVVMTAVADLASAPSSLHSTYVRIDNKKLLDSPDKTLEVLEKLFNLFIDGKVVDALKEAKKDDQKALLESFGKVVTKALEGIWKFIGETDITFSVVEGKFELKHS